MCVSDNGFDLDDKWDKIKQGNRAINRRNQNFNNAPVKVAGIRFPSGRYLYFFTLNDDSLLMTANDTVPWLPPWGAFGI
jgi:hypothetical protein